MQDDDPMARVLRRPRLERPMLFQIPDADDRVGFTLQRGPWTISGVLAVVDDRLLLVELAVKATEGDREVDSEAQRLWKLSDLTEVKALVVRSGRLRWEGMDRRLVARGRRLAAAARVEPKRGPQGLGDNHYRRVAVMYLGYIERGVTRGVHEAMAEAWGRPVSTVRTWVHEAREREFLSPGTQGKAGGQPGPRLYEKGQS